MTMNIFNVAERQSLAPIAVADAFGILSSQTRGAMLGEVPTINEPFKLLQREMITSLPDPEFVVGPPFMFARGQVGMVAAPTGLGKTTVMVAIGLHIATGSDFLGASVHGGRTLYLDFENVAETVKWAALRFARALGTNPDHEPFDYVRASWNLREERKPLIEDIRRGQYDAVIIDNLESAISLETNDSQDARDVMKEVLGEIAHQTGAAVIVVEHTSKSNPTSPSGSTKKMDFARPVHVLKPSGDTIQWSVLKPAFGPKPKDFRFKIVEVDGGLCIHPILATNNRSLQSQVRSRDERSVQRALRLDGPLNKNAIYHAVADDLGQKWESVKKRFQRKKKLSAMVAEGLIQVVDSPKKGDYFGVTEGTI